jgi:hypothetical protein
VDGKTIAAYVGAAVSIGFGVALLWFPPTNIAGQPGTVGAAFAFVTGGLAALGVTVTIPKVFEIARLEAATTTVHMSQHASTAYPGGTTVPHPPTFGHGFLVLRVNGGINSPDVNAALSQIAGQASPPTTVVAVSSLMASSANPGQPGDRVVVTVETNLPGRSQNAHDAIVALGQKIALLTNGAGNVVFGLENHWCCYSDQ